MIYVTGDTHGGDNSRILWQHYLIPFLSPGDTLIVTGDFGIGFHDTASQTEEQFLDFLAAQPVTILFCDGNHEDFHKLAAYPVLEWCGGHVHQLRPNVLHLIRGEIFEIEGKTLLVMGGGYSLDRSSRIEGYDWWPQEMPSKAEYDNCLTNLEKHQYQVDYILTHTAPCESVEYLSRIPSLGIKSYVPEELPLTSFLETLRRDVTYTHWYFGHFHVDREIWRKQYALLDDIRELHSGDWVKKRI